MATLVIEVGSTGEDQGGGCRGCTPLPPKMTCSFLTQLVFCIKLGYVTSQLHHSLVVYPLLREILDLPLKQVAIMYRPYIKVNICVSAKIKYCQLGKVTVYSKCSTAKYPHYE